MFASTIDTLLRQDVDGLQSWLDSFYPSPSRRPRRAWVGRTSEYVVIEALPLPDGYAPDEIDALLLVDNYPSLPPIGIYLLNNGNEHVVAQLRRKFSAFQDRAFHDAPSIEGYTWICYAYANNSWRYRASAPHKGDNLRKFIASFFAEAQQ
jgi:hypothetical protein